jgi:DNA-binding transcriptional ArsR family regulator/NAD-dependent dihydropyrimidine dehydrogenase PreA subunit
MVLNIMDGQPVKTDGARGRQYQAKLLRALAHPARLQILETLARRPACVCDLTMQLGRRQPYISQHLMVLRGAGLVGAAKEGLNVRYHLARPELTALLDGVTSICQRRFVSPSPTQAGDGGNPMSGNQNGTWQGLARSAIDWYPTVVAERCIGCGLCTTSCGRNVYAFNYELNKPVVVAPQMCMVGCTTCATTCPEDAIDFPARGYIRQVIKKNKVLRHTKDLLRNNREKYDVNLRAPVPA